MIAAGKATGADYRRVTEDDVQNMLHDGLLLPFKLEACANLNDALQVHKRWENKAQVGIGKCLGLGVW